MMKVLSLGEINRLVFENLEISLFFEKLLFILIYKGSQFEFKNRRNEENEENLILREFRFRPPPNI
jgi:hypothetical protein